MDFALSQIDLMESIGKEVKHVRETNANKLKFGEVINGINSIQPFIEVAMWKQRRPRNDDNFIHNLWNHCQCEGWPSEQALEEEFDLWYDSDDDREYILVKEDWCNVCPFKYQRDWQYDYYTVLKPC